MGLRLIGFVDAKHRRPTDYVTIKLIDIYLSAYVSVRRQKQNGVERIWLCNLQSTPL
jgi:hypothetical protein